MSESVKRLTALLDRLGIKNATDAPSPVDGEVVIHLRAQSEAYAEFAALATETTILRPTFDTMLSHARNGNGVDGVLARTLLAKLVSTESHLSSLEAEAAVLRRALDDIAGYAAFSPAQSDNAAWHALTVECPDIAQRALESTSAGQSILDELQQLRQREAGLKSFLGVLVKEMETFRERNIDRTFDYAGALAAGVSMMGQWQRQIEAICGAPSTPTEGPKEVPHG